MATASLSVASTTIVTVSPTSEPFAGATMRTEGGAASRHVDPSQAHPAPHWHWPPQPFGDEGPQVPGAQTGVQGGAPG
jgi:hypothetical protein